MKKFFAILLSAMLMLSLAVPTMAEDKPTTTYTLTLNNAQEGHTYTAYQIFAGDLSGNILSNITWGSGVTAEGQTALGNAAAKAESIETIAEAEVFAAEVAPYLATAAGSVTIAEKASSGEIDGLAAGYYLIQTTTTTETNGVMTYYIMKVIKDTEATIKAGVPEIDKTVDKSDINIGDTVTFTLTATMPSNLQGYETYTVIFHDTMSKGLTYGEITSVTVAGSVVTSGYTPATKVNDDGTTTLTITFADVLALKATAKSEIVVTYTAVVDSDAIIGTEGNPNEVYLEYSNNPNGEGTGKTPKDEVKVYTWEIPVFKYTLNGETKNPLSGAGFTLHKGNVIINLVAAGTNDDGDLIYKVCTKTGCSDHDHVTEIITGQTGKFEIEGLEQGTYMLTETTTPPGYNTCADITIEIGTDGVLTVDETTVKTVEVLNQAGSTLPETGGMGTTIFYIVGGLMAVGAVVLLITKKRMSAEG